METSARLKTPVRKGPRPKLTKSVTAPPCWSRSSQFASPPPATKARPSERPARGKARPQGDGADGGQQKRHQAEKDQLAQPGGKAGAEAQECSGVGGQLEPQRIGREGDARRTRQSIIGDLLRDVIASDGHQEEGDEDQSLASLHVAPSSGPHRSIGASAVRPAATILARAPGAAVVCTATRDRSDVHGHRVESARTREDGHGRDIDEDR